MFLTQKRLFIVLSFLLLVIGFRIISPAVILFITNRQLEQYSPHFAVHINDIDLRIMRGEYVLRGISGTLKPSRETFFSMQELIARIPWKNIFRGSLKTDVAIDKMIVVLSKELQAKAKAENKRRGNKDLKHLGIRTIEVRNSKVVFRASNNQITDLELKASNLSQDKQNLKLYFHLSGSLFGPAPFRAIGLAVVKNKITQLDVNAELKSFDLATLNPFFKESNIQSGKMDLYAEARSLEGHVRGYVKPFVSGLKVSQKSELMNKLLVNARKIPLEYSGGLKILDRYIQKDAPPGIDDSIGQRGLGRMMMQVWRQAQEEE